MANPSVCLTVCRLSSVTCMHPTRGRGFNFSGILLHHINVAWPSDNSQWWEASRHCLVSRGSILLSWSWSQSWPSLSRSWWSWSCPYTVLVLYLETKTVQDACLGPHCQKSRRSSKGITPSERVKQEGGGQTQTGESGISISLLIYYIAILYSWRINK